MYAARPIPPPGPRLSGHTGPKRTTSTPALSLTLVPESGHASPPSSPPQVLHCLPLAGTRGKLLQFHSFDEAYFERLRAGDFRTQEHFRVYFTALIQVKLRSRLQSREAIEDVRQETFVRFYDALHTRQILLSQSLGSYMKTICINHL